MRERETFEETSRRNLVAVAKAFARASGLSISTVGKKFHGKHTFFVQFERGEVSVTLPKIEEMLRSFGREWPDDAPRPRLAPAFMRLGGGK